VTIKRWFDQTLVRNLQNLMKRTKYTIYLAAAGLLLAAAGCSSPTQPGTVNASSQSGGAVPATPAAPAVPAAPVPVVKSDLAALQGTWKGHGVGDDADAAVLTIQGNNVEFRGADPNEWYKGTFTLKDDVNPHQCLFAISECGAPDYVGKTAYTIYVIENGTLRISGNEPGKPDAPASFEAEHARHFVFKK
jgi:uncharacterized protein (TIGR03067 family)